MADNIKPEKKENIVVWGFAVYYWLHLPFLKELKSRRNARIHFICSSPDSVNYWRALDQDGIIDSYATTGHLFDEYDKCDTPAEDIYKEARGFEEKYGIYAVDILQTDRHLGRGFSAAGTGHPRSRLSDKAEYVRSINILNRIFRFWEEYFDKINPELVIGLQANIIGKPFMAIARHRGVPVRVFKPAKYRSRHYWVVDEHYYSPDIEKNFTAISDVSDLIGEDDTEGQIREAHVTGVYAKFLKRSSKKALLKDITGQIKAHLYKKYKGITGMGGYRLSENIRYILRTHRYLRSMHSFKTVTLDELRGKRYILYPLHTEPEMALGTFSPEFNEQLAAIEFIAKNLPAGALLVVKEHLLAIGRRPKDFYSTILEIPNCVMVSPRLNALNVAEGSCGVAVITSTAGAEAAIKGIPVISFGAHNIINFLPHVHSVSSWMELRPLLHKLCGEEDPSEKSRRLEDGLRYLAAVKASSVEFDRKKLYSKEEEAKVLCSSLIESLDTQREAA